MKLSEIIRGGPIVVKTFDRDEDKITVIPGYCWGLEGFIKVFGTMPPYRGKSLYGTRINPRQLIKWPFNWGWGDVKGHIGPPKINFPEEHVHALMSARTPADLIDIAQRLGYDEKDPKIIGSSLVKSIKPGLKLENWDSYTNNFEAIINVPVTMYKIANGTHIPEHDLYNFGTSDDEILQTAHAKTGRSGL